MSQIPSAETSQISEEYDLSDIDVDPTTLDPTAGLDLQNVTSSTATKATAAGNPQDQQLAPPQNRGRRIVPAHQSRIQDRPAKIGEKDSNLKIKIELDLEVEVELYARVKGDIIIGLM